MNKKIGIRTISTNTIKILAIVAMFTDHIPFLFSDPASPDNYYRFPVFIAHAFGRLTAPIFFYMLAIGYTRTKNANRYTLRLLLFAVISYVPFIWYVKDSPPNASNFLNFNIMFGLLMGLLLLRIVYEVRGLFLKCLCIIPCAIFAIFCDYGLYGLACILVFGVCVPKAGMSEQASDLQQTETNVRIDPVYKTARLRSVAAYCAIMLVDIHSTFTYDFSDGWLVIMETMSNPLALAYLFVLLSKLLLPLILIWRHCFWANVKEERPGLFGKWFFYIIYPLHLTLLLLIREVLR